jgi:hypothetical protein
VSGKFYCTGEYPKSTNVKPLIFEIDNVGVRVANKAVIGAASIAASLTLEQDNTICQSIRFSR